MSRNRQPLHRLVIGCGKNCKNHNHPPDKWLTVDSTPEKNPHVVKKRYNDLTPADFFLNDSMSKFKFIFTDQLSKLNCLSMSKLKELFDARDGRAIIFFGWDGTNGASWECYRQADLNIQYFIYYHNKLILITCNDKYKVQNALEIIQTDLFGDEGCTDTYKNFFTVVKNEMERLRSERPQLPPLLNSVLAHIHAYVITRGERKAEVSLLSWLGYEWSVPLRNPFKDNDYKNFAAAMENTFVSFAEQKITLQQVLAEMQEKVKVLDLRSSNTETHKLSYTPLRDILEECTQALIYYEKQNPSVSHEVSREQRGTRP